MNVEFKKQIADIKYKHSLTQAEIAERIGVSRSYISEVINGRAPYSDQLREKIETEFEPNIKLDIIKSKEPHTVPLLPIFAQAGHLTGWSDAVKEAECERVISPVKDVDMAVHIYGESMSPDIPNGSVVYVHKIHPERFIDWGKAYILDTVDGPLLKYVAPGHDEGFVTCISANPDPMFAPFEVSKSDILGMYRVVMCMSMK